MAPTVEPTRPAQEGGERHRSRSGLSTLSRRSVVVSLILLGTLGACSSGDKASGGSVPRSSTASVSSSPTSVTVAGSFPTTGAPTSSTTGPIAVPGTSTPMTANTGTVPAETTVRGVVGGVFASARVIQLIPAVNGISSVALTVETEFIRAGGARAALSDVSPGVTIEAVGRSSAPGTLVARRITLQ